MALSKRNRRGLIWLLIVGLIVAYSPRFFAIFSNDSNFIVSFEEAKLIKKEIVATNLLNKKKNKKRKAKKYRVPPSSFDPNEYTESDWVNLGLSQKQAAVIVKFTVNGIYSNESLEKIFVLPKEAYDLIKDSTYYPDKKTNYYKDNESSVSVEKVIVNINLGSKEELEEIPGIGPFYAGKIIDYRKELGGYVDVNQLTEIWKFDNKKLVAMKPYIELGNLPLDKININTATIDQLKTHPYISYSVANSIVKMRNQRGVFKSLVEIKESKLINDELFQKIKTYLSI